MLHDRSVIRASQSHLSLSKGTCAALLSRDREKLSFDKLRMISRYAQLSNLQLVAP
jgi:hypothetical protein